MFSPEFGSPRRNSRTPLAVASGSPISCAILALLLLAPVLLARAVSPNSRADSPQPLIAIGDVHNDFDDFVAILQRTGLIDKQNHWSGGKTTFVQVGDLLDRGPKPREVVGLMMALEKEAEQAGGRVVSLLGNHEAMNIMGDLRYVTPMNFASFADANSGERQKAAYRDYVKWKGSHASLLAELPQPMELTEAEWMARHPLGFIEHREAFAPKGEYGAWLRGHAAVAEIEGIVFLHGGIQPDVAKIKLDAINKRVHEEIKTFDALSQYLQNENVILPFFTMQEVNNVLQAETIAEIKAHVPANSERQAKIQEFLKRGDWLSVREDGPLWFRGYDRWTDEEGATQIGKVLEPFKATHVVVGHTVQKGGRIRPRFGNKVFLIDTGMLSSYYPGGKPSALEICGDGKFIAMYLDEVGVLLSSAGFSLQGNWPGGHRGAEEGGGAVSEKLAVLSPDRVCSATTAAPQ
jgi:Calcineurin-like phosphoesterase